jgi:hypothetical protein
MRVRHLVLLLCCVMTACKPAPPVPVSCQEAATVDQAVQALNGAAKRLDGPKLARLDEPVAGRAEAPGSPPVLTTATASSSCLSLDYSSRPQRSDGDARVSAQLRRRREGRGAEA